jgi:hypothetical protein
METMNREHIPNPRRVLAGKMNRLKRGPLTTEGLERLRAAALRHQPWQWARGPKTFAGKLQSVTNGKKRQKGSRSLREIRAELAELRQWLQELRETWGKTGA